MAAPIPEKARVLLTDPKRSPAELDAIGDQFLAEQRPNLAVMFYERTRTPDRAQRILDLAVKTGDGFLMDWVARVHPDLARPDLWRRVAEAALASKKLSFAVLAFRKAGDETRAEEALKELNQSLSQPVTHQ